MDRTKKILLISIIPAALTLLFIIYILVPSIDKMNLASSELSKANNAFEENQVLYNDLKEKSRFNRELEDLKVKLADFDVKVPAENDLPILLYDLERFADSTNIRISNFKAEREKKLIIVDPKEEKKLKKKNTRKKSDKKSSENPYDFAAIPVKLIITGQYLNTLKFINILQNYGRKIYIEDITVSENKPNDFSSRPDVEMQINLKIYKLSKVSQEVSPTETKGSN